MKILLCSLEGDGAWFAWLLRHNGHDVDWTVEKDKATPYTMAGIIPAPLTKANPKNYDLIVFDSTDMGEDADHATKLGIPTMGDSTFADRLENDRLFGLEMMEKCGIRVPPWEAFDDPGKAIDWLRKNHKRTVLKPFGDMPKELTYVSHSEDDMIAFIEQHSGEVKQFVLQEFVQGTEISTEAWWTGTEWVALNHDLEEKKFMSGSIGPNTGCAGNVIWMPSRPTPLFQQGLEKASPLLVDAAFRGMVDLNAIVTEGVLYGLEWTPRFGYEGACNLTRLLPIEFGEFLHAVATGAAVPNTESRHKFCATVRLSVPPYPNKVHTPKMEAHQPIKGLREEELDRFYTFNVQRDGDSLIVAGDGSLGTPLGCGSSIAEAFKAVQLKIDELEVPDLQYRNDIEKSVTKRYITLQQQGWLRQIG